MNDELKTLMVFGGAAMLLSKARKPKASPAVLIAPVSQAGPAIQKEPIQGVFSLTSSGWEDTNYLGGFVVGAASVAAAWYTWSVLRPKLRHAATPASY